MKIDTSSTLVNEFIVADAAFLPPKTNTQPVVGQLIEDNFFDRSGDILGNFVESGQLWALLIGIVVGYLIRGMTTY
ncbi:hypothetical protein [Leptothoe kymatousa]|uniref:Uncharacterized protein n=1 Tax=Leptothoe kymatousa TAU-MAC 1615 TaxID=2364775 RepID=A0ABS5Y144_9CYAN|nr:hypothetical protein [Leptothoe kymatousa]MBT9311341.1 hypothetical protein [Leptothoe kymatousa TAU-MAC 1615]